MLTGILEETSQTTSTMKTNQYNNGAYILEIDSIRDLDRGNERLSKGILVTFFASINFSYFSYLQGKNSKTLLSNGFIYVTMGHGQHFSQSIMCFRFFRSLPLYNKSFLFGIDEVCFDFSTQMPCRTTKESNINTAQSVVDWRDQQ